MMRSRSSGTQISAQLDGEVAQNSSADARGPADESGLTYERMRHLSDLLRGPDAPDLDLRMDRSYEQIFRRLAVARPERGWFRWQQIRVPLPAVAAVAVLIAALGFVVAWSFMSRPVPTAPDLLAEGKAVDVTIRVDNSDMETVLQWLVDKEMLGEISIQLPEQEFSFVGDPVLLKPDDYPEGFRE